MTGEELKRLATKELIAYVKGQASGMCPASMEYWKEHVEETFNRIVSLEKENEELRTKYLQATDEGTSWAHLKSLEKEVAELKKQQFTLRNERNAFLAQNEQYEKDLMDINENLAKAKEILAKLLEEEKNNMYWEMNGSDKSSYYKVRKEAERFLEDVKE